MHVFVLPVSGGGFVVQLAIIQHLSGAKLLPNVCLASSGGNVAAYIAAAADYQWAAIERISRELNNTIFVQPWSSIRIISSAIGFFQGYLYDKGTGVGTFLQQNFTPESIVKYEIWTGTYNQNKQKARLFCNRSKENSILAQYKLNQEIVQSMPTYFANGDIPLLATASLASASIPAIVPPQMIENEPYSDGGSFAASPLTIMKNMLMKYISDFRNKSKASPMSGSGDGSSGSGASSGFEGNSMHLYYLSSVNLDQTEDMNSNNVLDVWRKATEDLIRSSTVTDRLQAYDILQSQNAPIKKMNFSCSNPDALKKINHIYKKCRYSLLELYPTKIIEIDIVNFVGQDVVNAINEAYKVIDARFWWISEGDDIDNEITTEFSERTEVKN